MEFLELSLLLVEGLPLEFVDLDIVDLLVDNGPDPFHEEVAPLDEGVLKPDKPVGVIRADFLDELEGVIEKLADSDLVVDFAEAGDAEFRRVVVVDDLAELLVDVEEPRASLGELFVLHDLRAHPLELLVHLFVDVVRF